MLASSNNTEMSESTDKACNLPTNLPSDPVRIAIIGGTGLAVLPCLHPVATVNPETPWGRPSSPITVALFNGSTPIAFLARHGSCHQFAPHEVPFRANIAALRHIGVRCIVAFSAVGSLQAEIKPTDFVVPDQIIDNTKGVRPFTFFEDGVVGHVGFADPFNARLAKVIKGCAKAMDGIVLHDKGTIIVIEGPQFSTRAESNLYRSWGGTIIGMNAVPEAKLAREAEMAYQTVGMVTDYDCWHSTEEVVNAEMVVQAMDANGENAAKLIEALLHRLTTVDEAEYETTVMARDLKGGSLGATKSMTKSEWRNQGTVKRLQYLFPGFLEDT